MVKKPSYPRKGAPPPIKKKAGLTSDEDGAQKDKATGRGLQKKMENGPRKGVEESKIIWAHLNLRDDNAIHLGGSPPLTASVSQVLREVCNEQFLRWPTQMKSNPATRDKTRYC